MKATKCQNTHPRRGQAQAAAEKVLRDLGAELMTTEDRHGDTHTGWWLDGVWLAQDAVDAVREIKG